MVVISHSFWGGKDANLEGSCPQTHVATCLE